MDPSLSRLNYLLQRYGDREATPAERLELMEALQAGTMEDTVRQWILERIERYDSGGRENVAGRENAEESENAGKSPVVEEGTRLSEERAERLLAGILQAGRVAEGLRKEDGSVMRGPGQEGGLAGGEAKIVRMRPGRFRRRVWMAAASVLLLVAGVGGYRALTGKTEQPAVAFQRPVREDVASGKHAAVLTLANGERILLDSSMQDTVGRQGKATIIVLQGRLTYKGLPGAAVDEISYNTLTTNAGNQYQLVLPDGSKVWLNAASSIRFPASFGEKERKVEITGEAYFEVAANANKPFLVQHGDMTVKVLGTNFNINTYTDEQAVTATLLEGAISVVSGGKSRMMRPGQQARMGSGGDINILDGINTDEVVAWKNDLFYFRSADIGTILRQLARWYDIRVEGNAAIDERFYAKIPKNASLSEVLDALSMTGKVHFDIEGRTVRIRP